MCRKHVEAVTGAVDHHRNRRDELGITVFCPRIVEQDLCLLNVRESTHADVNYCAPGHAVEVVDAVLSNRERRTRCSLERECTYRRSRSLIRPDVVQANRVVGQRHEWRYDEIDTPARV